MPCTLGSCDIICLVLALCVWTCGCDCVWMCGDVFVWVWYVCVMCSSVVLVQSPGHFLNVFLCWVIEGGVSCDVRAVS